MKQGNSEMLYFILIYLKLFYTPIPHDTNLLFFILIYLYLFY